MYGFYSRQCHFSDLFVLFGAVCDEHEASIRQLEYLHSVVATEVRDTALKIIL